MQSFQTLYAPTPISLQQLQILQLLNTFNPYQQFQMPFQPNNQPFIMAKDEDFFNPNQQLYQFMQSANARPLVQQIQQSPLPYCIQDNQATESTQENSPKPAFYPNGLNINDCFSLQEKSQEKQKVIYTVEKSSFNPTVIAEKSQDKNSSEVPLCKKIKKQQKTSSIKKMRKGSACPDISCSVQPQSSQISQKGGLLDDKNIIHINFTKNLLKSFRRYCEYYHKSNQALLNQIKRDFETNHMNNQLLVHFMTSPITMEYFSLFVDGPAQKWVKEQSRLKKQDQQLELIEICRSRIFDKIKVKKYSNDASFAGDDSVIIPNAATIAPLSQNATAHPIFNNIDHQTASIKLASSEKGASRMNKNYSTSKNKKRQIQHEGDDNSYISSSSSSSPSALSYLSSRPGDKKVFEAKIEEVESVKIEDC